MEQDACGSRDASVDPGCLRFDLLRDRENPNRFLFYEAYTNDEAIGHHKTTPHYKAEVKKGLSTLFDIISHHFSKRS